MSNECDETANSSLPFLKSSESVFTENFSNGHAEEPMVKIKEEPTDNLDNSQINIQDGVELVPLVEFKIEQDDPPGPIELKVEGKVETEEPADDENILEISLKTEIDSANNQKQRQPNVPDTQDSSKSNLFHCAFCNYTAKISGNLKTHINRIHLKYRPYKCDVCSYECVQKFDLERHKLSHFKKCRYCDYVGINQKALSVHRIANHSTYQCRFCDFVTKRKGGLQRHENAIHLKKEKYSCSICSYTSLYKCSVDTHMRLKHNQKMYFNCDKCDHKAKTHRSLQIHINAIHTKSELVYCAHCSYTSTFKRLLAVHLRKNHSLIDAFKCEKCDFASKERIELERHVKVEHRKNYRFECNDCGFLAKFKLRIEEHILSRHLKQKLFECKLCSYRGCTKNHIFRHAKVKHEESFVNRKLIKGEFDFWKKLNS